MARTIVGLFDRTADAEAAIRHLVDIGVDRNDIGVVTRHSDTVEGEAATQEGNKAGEGAVAGAGIGAVLGGVGGLLAGLGALAIPGIGPIIAAGPLVAALTGAGIGAGAGALVGSLVGLGIPKEEAELYAEGIRRGGTLVTVRSDDLMAERVVDVLNQHHPVDVQRRSSTWRKSGWTGWDENAGPYTEGERPPMGAFPTTHEPSHVRQEEGRVIETREGSNLGEAGRRAETGMGSTRPTSTIRSWETYNDTFRSDFTTNYGNSRFTYDYYQPAYRYGYDLANDPVYSDRDWTEIEPEARRRWEREHPDSAWEEFKDTIHRAWLRVRGETVRTRR